MGDNSAAVGFATSAGEFRSFDDVICLFQSTDGSIPNDIPRVEPDWDWDDD